RTYAWMVPNGSWGESNAGLVVGRNSSLLIDTQWDLRFTRHMLKAMEPLTGSAPVTRLVNTHADGDHTWGNQLLAPAEIIASDAAAREMREVRPLELRMLGLMGRLLSLVPLKGAARAGRWFRNMTAPYDFQGVKPTLPTRTFSGSLTIDLDGRVVELIEAGPAHTRGDVMVFVPDARVLFAGDILFIGSTPVMWAGPLENWLRALDTILELDTGIIVPGHGPVTDKNGVREAKAYWEFLERHVYERYRQGFPPGRAARDIVFGTDFLSLPFARHDSPERIMTSTHVIYRHLQGRPGPLKPLEMVVILWRQALLAHDLLQAGPASTGKTLQGERQ
ncbi:MAG: MBL fold metallo-hydrolase, partial [Desulfomonilia bacterium]